MQESKKSRNIRGGVGLGSGPFPNPSQSDVKSRVRNTIFDDGSHSVTGSRISSYFWRLHARPFQFLGPLDPVIVPHTRSAGRVASGAGVWHD